MGAFCEGMALADKSGLKQVGPRVSDLIFANPTSEIIISDPPGAVFFCFEGVCVCVQSNGVEQW